MREAQTAWRNPPLSVSAEVKEMGYVDQMRFAHLLV
jgi:hypothetical protein